MRPLIHPPISEVTVEGILYALSDTIRVQIYIEIAASSCPQTCSAFLSVRGRDLPKSTLSQHFKILREAGLIRSVRKGVELHNSSRCSELKARYGDMISNIIQAYSKQHQSQTKRTSKNRK